MTQDHLPSPRLPPELTDHIISFLHGHKEALYACSLVCKDWLPATRYQQFNALRIQFKEINHLERLLKESPDVRSYVTSLSIQCNLREKPVFTRETIAGPLREVLKNIPNLVDIEFSKLGLTLLPEDNVNWYPDTFPFVTVERLRFGGSIIPLAAFALFIAPYFRIKELCFDQCLMGMTKPLDDLQRRIWSVFRPPTRLVVRSGTISSIPDLLYGLFTWGKDNPELPTLIFEVQESSHVPGLVSILQHLGGTIKHLELIVNSDTSIPRRCIAPLPNIGRIFLLIPLYSELFLPQSGFYLGQCTALQFCRLTFHLREMFVSENQSLRWIHDCLGQLSSANLEIIELVILADPMTDLRALDSECGTRPLDYVNFDTMQELDWRRLESMFTKERLGSLEKVVLVGKGESSGICNFLHQSHPGLGSVIAFQNKDDH